jgi:hypothetical protein
MKNSAAIALHIVSLTALKNLKLRHAEAIKKRSEERFFLCGNAY